MINGVSQPHPYTPRPNAAPAANLQAGGTAQAPSAPIVRSVSQAPSAQNQVEPLGQMLTQMFSALATALKGLISWVANLFQQPSAQQPAQPPVQQSPVSEPPVQLPPVGQQPTQPPVVEPPVQQPTQPAAGDVNVTAIAQQYNLLATAENVQAFLDEVKRYESEGALGPSSANAQAVKDLQAALSKLGFPVPATGIYDNLTAEAVIAFKKQNGLRQSYQSANGQFAVNEYAEKQTLELIMQKLEALMAQPPAQPAPAQPPVQQPAQPPVVEPPVQPPVVQQKPAQPPVQQPPAQQQPAQPPVQQPPAQQQPAQPPVQQPPAQQQPTQPAAGNVNVAAIAQQYNLQATPENVQAFLDEVKTYEATGALGPGTTNTSAVKDLQGALRQLGFSLPATGVYDNATAQAVIAFKKQNGLRQGYKSANGQFAVNEYADKQTLQLLMRKLEALMAQPPAQPAPTPAPAPAPQPPVQQPAQPQPAPAPAAPATAPSNPLGLEWQTGAPSQPAAPQPVPQAAPAQPSPAPMPAPAPAPAPAPQPQAPNPLGVEWVG